MAVPTQIANLLPLARPYLPDCPDNLIVREIRSSARQFCEKSRGWVVTLETVSVDGTASYGLDALISALSVDATLLEVHGVKVNGCMLYKSEYAVDDSHNLVLDTAPNEDDWDIEVVASLLPNTTWSTLIAAFLSRYADPIVAGAIWRLQSMQDRTWSAPYEAKRWKNEFYRGIGQVRRERVGGRRGGIAARPV